MFDMKLTLCGQRSKVASRYFNCLINDKALLNIQTSSLVNQLIPVKATATWLEEIKKRVVALLAVLDHSTIS